MAKDVRESILIVLKKKKQNNERMRVNRKEKYKDPTVSGCHFVNGIGLIVTFLQNSTVTSIGPHVNQYNLR